MESLKTTLKKMNLSETTFKNMSHKDFEQFKVDSLNEAEGNRHLEDGYNCPICKNKGYIAKLQQINETYTHYIADCKCADVRRSILRMKKSGLKDIIKDYTFEKYETRAIWQETIKNAALEFAKNPNGWFFLGGQSGAGKTHLCTAICRDFLLNGRSVVYMIWHEDTAKIKGLSMEADRRQDLIDRYKKAEVLYIDDLFKPVRNSDGSIQMPTGADIKLAFEIINYRYNNHDLITIISSEWTEDELLDIDEATGGRIFERSKTLSIARDRKRNYRTRKAITV